MKLEDFATDTYVRRPFQVQAFEITPDNIAELAAHVGELCEDDRGTPFIKSEKKKVGNSYKVWPGFFATVLKGQVRCYSRKTFFDQFGELNDKTSPMVEFLHGRCTVEEMISELQPDAEKGEPDQEEPKPVVEAIVDPPVEELPEVADEKVDVCEHGTPVTQECVYKKCGLGDKVDEDGDEDENVNEPESGSSDVASSTIEQYRAGLESVIKP